MLKIPPAGQVVKLHSEASRRYKGSAKASACADYHPPGVRCGCTAPRGLVSRYSGPNLAVTPLQEPVCGRAASGPRGDPPAGSVLLPRERRGQTHARTHVRGRTGLSSTSRHMGSAHSPFGPVWLTTHTHTQVTYNNCCCRLRARRARHALVVGPVSGTPQEERVALSSESPSQNSKS